VGRDRKVRKPLKRGLEGKGADDKRDAKVYLGLIKDWLVQRTGNVKPAGVRVLMGKGAAGRKRGVNLFCGIFHKGRRQSGLTSGGRNWGHRRMRGERVGKKLNKWRGFEAEREKALTGSGDMGASVRRRKTHWGDVATAEGKDGGQGVQGVLREGIE